MRRGCIRPFAALLVSTGLILAWSSTSRAQVTTNAPPPPTPISSGTVVVGPSDGEPVPVDFAHAADREGNRWYFGAEYLVWWFKDSPVPVPLLTTTSDPTAMPVATITDPNTSVLLGNQDFSTGAHQGARFTAGGWIDDRRQVGIEGGYFFLASHSTVRSFASNGQPDAAVLAVPFFDADAGAESSFVVASPGAFSGSAVLSLTSKLQGADLGGMVAVADSNNLHVQVLAGFRYLDLNENLTYSTVSTGLQDPNTGLIFNTTDEFGTRNQFYGCQLGTRVEYRSETFFVQGSVKLAAGDMHEVAHIVGSATTNFFNGPTGGPFTGVPTQVLPGSGMFAQPSNAFRTSRHQFAFSPEVGLKVGYRVTSRLHVFAGYDFLYVTNVIRPGDQIDRSINPSQTVQAAVAGATPVFGTRPAVPLIGSDFWAQGITVGVEFRY